MRLCTVHNYFAPAWLPPLPTLYNKRPCIVSGGGGILTFTFPNVQKSSILSFSRGS